MTEQNQGATVYINALEKSHTHRMLGQHMIMNIQANFK